MPGKITIDELARIIQENVVAKMATGEDIVALRSEMNRRLNSVETRLDDIDTRLGSVERLLTSNRIDRIEDDIRILKTKTGVA